MSETWRGILAAWASMTIFVLFLGTIIWGHAYPGERRAIARVVLLCWAWPLLAVYGLGLMVGALWRDAR